MRLIGAASIVFALALTFAVAEFPPALTASQTASRSDDGEEKNDERKHRRGKPSSATTPSATSSCGPMCCGCTK